LKRGPSGSLRSEKLQQRFQRAKTFAPSKPDSKPKFRANPLTW